jgi:hypothetical protein
MGPPSRRKTSRNWTQMGFLFTSMLILLLSNQGNNVKAQQNEELTSERSFDTTTPTSVPNSNVTTSTTILGLNNTVGKSLLQALFHFSFT